MKTSIHNSRHLGFRNIAVKLMLCLAAISLASCDKEDDATVTAPVNTPASAGTADITVTAGGEEFKVAGLCGWAVAGGVHYIGAKHSDNSKRIFEASFNIDALPTQTTTYTLVESITDEDPAHITMYVSQVNDADFIEWESSDTSGTLTLVVNGNEITADLSGITLHPSQGSNNPGALDNAGVLSGTLKFYR